MPQEKPPVRPSTADDFPSSARPIFVRFFIWLLMMGLIVLVVIATNEDKPVKKSDDGAVRREDVTDPFHLNTSESIPSSAPQPAPTPEATAPADGQ